MFFVTEDYFEMKSMTRNDNMCSYGDNSCRSDEDYIIRRDG